MNIRNVLLELVLLFNCMLPRMLPYKPSSLRINDLIKNIYVVLPTLPTF